MRPLNELRKHPAYCDLSLTVSSVQLTAVQNLGEDVFKDPLLITRAGIIIDGYARRELAEKQGILTLCCVEFDIDEDEALRRILDHHRRSSGWNDYNRIRIASNLREATRQRAKANQQAGGRFKASSKLTKAEKVSVRKEIAHAAGVSEGSVTKVDQLEGLHPELVAALQSGEIRIHRAQKQPALNAPLRGMMRRKITSQRARACRTRETVNCNNHEKNRPHSAHNYGDLLHASRRHLCANQ
jgi:hypothetical protein